MTKSRRCRGTNVDGTTCEQPTKDPSGYCRHHREEAESLEVQGVLRCGECTHQSCPKRGIGVNGLCYYEVYDTVDSVEDFDRLRRTMKDAIKFERTLYRRLARALATGHSSVIDTDGVYHDELPKRVQSLVDSLVKNLESYAKLSSWDKIEGRTTHKDKLKTLERMFDLEDEAPVTVGGEPKTIADVVVASPVTSSSLDKSPEEIRREKARAAKFREIDLTEDVEENENGVENEEEHTDDNKEPC